MLKNIQKNKRGSDLFDLSLLFVICGLQFYIIPPIP